MGLLQLEVEQFRCIERAQLLLDPVCNLIVGQNASGKTSLLEAAYVLGSGHSFRTHHTDTLIRHGQHSFMAVGRVNTAAGTEVIGIRGSALGKEARVNGEPARSQADLALRLPIQAIEPEVHRLLEDGPARRRRYLDWGVFHVEQRFHPAWRRYQRVLQQRNAALKARQSPKVIRVWDQEFIEQGEQIACFRDDYIDQLRPVIAKLGKQLLGLDVEVEHQRGWKRAITLDVALNESFERDLLRGQSGVGPHRADLSLKVAGVIAKDRVSRGQQKMLACTLILSQQIHRAIVGAPPACLLLDDPAAELDVDNLGKLLLAVADIPAQLIVSGLDQTALRFFPSARMFHVEHGIVQAMA